MLGSCGKNVPLKAGGNVRLDSRGTDRVCFGRNTGLNPELKVSDDPHGKKRTSKIEPKPTAEEMLLSLSWGQLKSPETKSDKQVTFSVCKIHLLSQK